MPAESLDFVNDQFEPQPSTARFATLRLIAFFPVQANAGAILFSKPSEASRTWTVIAKGEVDNNKFTAAGEAVTFPIKAGNFYALQFAGEAHAIEPKASEVKLAFHVEVEGGQVMDLGGTKQVGKSSAIVRGAAFFRT